MKLESLILEVRPRTPWESMDLAIRLVANYWKILFSSWLVCILPIAIIIHLILLENFPNWSVIVFWWFKPLYDRVPLFVISRVIFSEKTTLKDVFNAIPGFFNWSLLASLTWRRFDTGRSLWLPLVQLEKLKGKRLSERKQSLSRGTNNRETVFMILCVHLESLLTLGLVLFVLVLMPEETAKQSVERLMQSSANPSLLYDSISMGLYFCIMMIIETLYVVGGFVLYLNRRIILEGWDIELMFKKLTQRQQLLQKKSKNLGFSMNQSKPLAILACTVFFAFSFINSETVYAQASLKSDSVKYQDILPPLNARIQPAEQSTQVILDVMEDPAFNTIKHIERLKYIGDKKEKKKKDSEDLGKWSEIIKNIGKMLAVVFEYALWIVLLIIIALIVKYRHHFKMGWRKKKTITGKKPATLFGLDVRQESLPDNVAEEAMRLYQEQQFRESMALLYRASLAFWVNNYHFNLKNGATEGDCVVWAEQLSMESKDHQSQVTFFSHLTHAWQITAYAHRYVNESEMQQLCDNWSQHFVRTEIGNGSQNQTDKQQGVDDE